MPSEAVTTASLSSALPALTQMIGNLDGLPLPESVIQWGDVFRPFDGGMELWHA